jgi:hypothetical protein
MKIISTKIKIDYYEDKINKSFENIIIKFNKKLI